MGSMDNGKGGGFPARGDGDSFGNGADFTSDEFPGKMSESGFPGGNFENRGSSDNADSTEQGPGNGPFSNKGNSSFSPPDGAEGLAEQPNALVSKEAWILLGASVVILLARLLIVLKFKRHG